MNTRHAARWRQLLTVAGVAFAVALGGAASVEAGSLLDKLGLQKQKKAALPAAEVASGLKEALATGTTNAINSLGRNDGFWANEAVRIAMPESLQKVSRLARQLGQGDKVDAFELSMNRAAEKAVPQVADIFGDAIRNMSVKDAQAILVGGDHAATDYFRRVAGDELKARIEPIVSQATSSVGVTERYKALSRAGGDKLGGVVSLLGNGDKDEKPLDLDDYVTNKTLDGLFTVIGDEEKSIRTDPLARSTDLLKKVFGS